MADYKGIKIPNEIILVEKLNDRGEISQAYVVDKGNTKMLENAVSWAKTRFRKKDDSGEYIRIPRGHYIDYDWYEVDGIQHEYKNGNFQLELLEAADGSSQGGKLSFWNCKIITTDNKEFSVGINSELLIDILKRNTWINGKCQTNKVWLGRVKGSQVGVFTENLENFKQAYEDEKQRTAKKSSSYKPGTVIKTLNSVQVYAGELYKRYEIEYNSSRYWYNDSYAPEVFITIYKKPKKVYGFLGHDWQDSSKWRLDYIEVQSNKQARIITGETVDFNLKDVFDNWQAKKLNYAKDDLSRLKRSEARTYFDFWYLPIYSLENEALTKDALIEAIKAKYAEVSEGEFPFEKFRIKYIEE